MSVDFRGVVFGLYEVSESVAIRSQIGDRHCQSLSQCDVSIPRDEGDTLPYLAFGVFLFPALERQGNRHIELDEEERRGRVNLAQAISTEAMDFPSKSGSRPVP